MRLLNRVVTISRSGEKRKSAGGIAPPSALGDLALDDLAFDDLAFDDCLRFDLDEHQWIDESPHLDHRRGRPDVLEELTVGAPNVFPANPPCLYYRKVERIIRWVFFFRAMTVWRAAGEIREAANFI